MAVIETFEGPAFINDEAIWRLQGPSPIFPYTRVFGPNRTGFETAEPPESIAGRLKLAKALSVLTRPDGKPVWLKGRAVSVIAAPLDADTPEPPAFVKARIIIAGSLQLVQDTVAKARKILVDGGAEL